MDESCIVNLVINMVKTVYCFENVEQMSNEHSVIAVYDEDVDGERLKGRPRFVWLAMIKSILNEGRSWSLNVRRSCVIHVTE